MATINLSSEIDIAAAGIKATGGIPVTAVQAQVAAQMRIAASVSGGVAPPPAWPPSSRPPTAAPAARPLYPELRETALKSGDAEAKRLVASIDDAKAKNRCGCVIAPEIDRLRARLAAISATKPA